MSPSNVQVAAGGNVGTANSADSQNITVNQRSSAGGGDGEVLGAVVSATNTGLSDGEVEDCRVASAGYAEDAAGGEHLEPVEFDLRRNRG